MFLILTYFSFYQVDEFVCRIERRHSGLPYYMDSTERAEISGVASLLTLRELDPDVSTRIYQATRRTASGQSTKWSQNEIYTLQLLISQLGVQYDVFANLMPNRTEKQVCFVLKRN